MHAERFVEAQDAVWETVLAELRAGAKRTHWMWFVFPQLAALGRSPRAKYYGLEGAADARAYAAHPVLGPRLREAVAAAMDSGVRDPVSVFGPVDAVKLRSCLTLFAATADGPEPFEAGLAHFFGGEKDAETLRRLRG
jgi:uncharacterized protein (DUF1810 family)